jgi:hypothetical protein
MNLRFIILIAVVLFSFAACSSTRGLYDAGAAAAGGVIANKLSNGDPLMTGAGAAGGVAIAEIAQTMSAKSGDTQYKNGYNKGRSDAVKQQYWVVQNQQKTLKPVPQPKVTYLPITVGGGTNQLGVVTVPTTQTIRIEQ